MDLSDCDLAGAGVLVTRAAHQAEGLCRLIGQLNGRPLRLPCIEISAPQKTGRLCEVLAGIENFDMAIFISANAVGWGLKQLSNGHLPTQVKIAAVGLATAQALADSGHRVDVVPKRGFDSEALLAEPELSAERLAGKRILIFRGQGGRELLRDTLSRRGALVEYAEVYQRRCPEQIGDLGRMLCNNDLDLITATSRMVLDNLFQLFGSTQREHLQQAPLIVISERMRDHARALGCRQVVVAAGPDDRSIVEAICRWVLNR